MAHFSTQSPPVRHGIGRGRDRRGNVLPDDAGHGSFALDSSARCVDIAIRAPQGARARTCIAIASLPLLIGTTQSLAQDFNGDWFNDVAIGAPAEDGEIGLVNVLYGSPGGLTLPAIFIQPGPWGGAPQPGSTFGFAVATGNFNGDLYSDLAASAPFYDVTSPDNGIVFVYYGTPAGLTPGAVQIWHQNIVGIVESCDAGDQFGYSLAVGDFDNNGCDDLVIGVPGEEVGTAPANHGAIHILYGSAGGLSATGDAIWHQNSTGVEGVAEANDNFGLSLSTGDYDGDLFDDVAIGVPREAIGALADAGAVNILYGSAGGITSAGDQILFQDSAGILDVSEAGDLWGWSLASGRFNGDSFFDLAVGAPGEELAGLPPNHGIVHVVYSDADGPGPVDAIWHQDSVSVLDLCEPEDQFGYELAAGNFNADNFDDLAIGIPYENVGSITDAGAVSVLPGGPPGISGTDDKFIHQNVLGYLDVCETGDLFGWALTGTRTSFNNDPFGDLLVGIPREDLGPGLADTGAAQEIRGSPAGLTEVGDVFWHQSMFMPGQAEPGDLLGYSATAR